MASIEYFSKRLLEDAMRKADLDRKNIEKKEEWVWVDGYKGVHNDMTGWGGYQFELGKQFDIPEGEIISKCRNGFHFCRTLNGVFRHYKIGDGNRFFKVSGLVRASDATDITDEKLVARSVTFLKELDVEEIFESRLNEKHWSREDKTLALAVGVREVEKLHAIDRLVNFGYSKPFAALIVQKGKAEVAEAVGHQSDLSMDMKVYVIFSSSNALGKEFLDTSFNFQNAVYGSWERGR